MRTCSNSNAASLSVHNDNKNKHVNSSQSMMTSFEVHSNKKCSQ